MIIMMMMMHVSFLEIEQTKHINNSESITTKKESTSIKIQILLEKENSEKPKKNAIKKLFLDH